MRPSHLISYRYICFFIKKVIEFLLYCNKNKVEICMNDTKMTIWFNSQSLGYMFEWIPAFYKKNCKFKLYVYNYKVDFAKPHRFWNRIPFPYDFCMTFLWNYSFYCNLSFILDINKYCFTKFWLLLSVCYVVRSDI